MATPEEGRGIQKNHVKFLEGLSRDGRALAAGPIVGPGTLRSVVILDVGSVEAAEKLMAEAPWVRHGMFKVEIHPWWAAAGILQTPPAFFDLEPTTLGLLKRPADAPEFSEERLAEMQAGHLANIAAMADAGDLVIAGPMGDDTTLRGILLFRTTDRERVTEMTAKDPSIQANRLELELLERHISRGTLPPAAGESDRLPGLSAVYKRWGNQMARPYGQTKRLPLKTQHADQMFWAKLTALWHRERMREVYVATGVEAHEARHRANREALDIAKKHGWSGQLPQLKSALAKLIVNELPGRGKVRAGQGVRYWEEQTQKDMMRILALPAGQIETELIGYLKDEVSRNGKLAGRTGFYKLTHIVGFMPTTEHLAKREAFLRVLNEIGHDRECADREIYRVVLRVLHTYTHKPFETRLGEPMPGRLKDGIRKVFGFLPFRSS